jgi:hypothetical protein
MINTSTTIKYHCFLIMIDKEPKERKGYREKGQGGIQQFNKKIVFQLCSKFNCVVNILLKA